MLKRVTDKTVENTTNPIQTAIRNMAPSVVHQFIKVIKRNIGNIALLVLNIIKCLMCGLKQIMKLTNKS